MTFHGRQKRRRGAERWSPEDHMVVAKNEGFGSYHLLALRRWCDVIRFAVALNGVGANLPTRDMETPRSRGQPRPAMEFEECGKSRAGGEGRGLLCVFGRGRGGYCRPVGVPD